MLAIETVLYAKLNNVITYFNDEQNSAIKLNVNIL